MYDVINFFIVPPPQFQILATTLIVWTVDDLLFNLKRTRRERQNFEVLILQFLLQLNLLDILKYTEELTFLFTEEVKIIQFRILTITSS